VWTSLYVPTGYNDTSLTREVISFPTVEKVKCWGFHSSFIEDLCLLGSDSVFLTFWRKILPTEHQQPQAQPHTLSHPTPPGPLGILVHLCYSKVLEHLYKTTQHHIHHNCSTNTHYAVFNSTRCRTGMWLHVLATLSTTKGSLALNRRLGEPNGPCGLFGGEELNCPS
jgi:hypothetical protein